MAVPERCVSARGGETMATGTGQRYDTARGFGSTRPDNGGADVFVHRSALGASRYVGLAAGGRVDFEPESGPKGPRAKSVRSAQGPRASLTGSGTRDRARSQGFPGPTSRDQ